MQLPQPYIGITGFTTEDQIQSVLHLFSTENITPQQDRTGMVGFAVDHNLINNSDYEHPHAPRYITNIPQIASLATVSRKRAFNVIHYTPINRQFTADDAAEIIQECYEKDVCRAMQINGNTPCAKQIDTLTQQFPELKIIFSIHPELIQNGHEAVVQKLQDYRKKIQYALIDPSLGYGRNMNVETSVDIAKAIEDADLGITIGFAGGFSGSNAQERIQKLKQALGHTNFCIDAEGKLHNKKDVLDNEKMMNYIQEANKGFTQS